MKKQTFNINNLKITLNPDAYIKAEEGNVTLLVQSKETGSTYLTKAFGEVFEFTKKTATKELKIQNVKFKDVENKIEYIRWYSGGDKHAIIRDAASNGRNNPIAIVIEKPNPKYVVQYDENNKLVLDQLGKPIKVKSEWKTASIIDYN